MGRKRKELPVVENVEITGVAAEGKALPASTIWWCLYHTGHLAMWST